MSKSEEKHRDWGAVEKPNKLHQKRERSKKQGLGTRRFSACLYLLFTAAGLFQHTHWVRFATAKPCLSRVFSDAGTFSTAPLYPRFFRPPRFFNSPQGPCFFAAMKRHEPIVCIEIQSFSRHTSAH